MALADLTTTQRNKLKRMMIAVAAEQGANPEKLAFNQLFDALFDTNAQRAARIDMIVQLYKDMQQAAFNSADANNTAHKAVLTAEIADADAIIATT